MKNTSILIPIILIACLLALAYLITRAFQDGDVNADGGGDRITLNPADYADEPAPADPGASTATDDARLDDYFTDADAEEATVNDFVGDDDAAPAPADGRVMPDRSRLSNEDSRPAPSATAAPPSRTTATGRYLVIAGSFRQLANARERVSNLRAAGFGASAVEKFNRGAFAVALAGHSDSYGEAEKLAQRIRNAGFEARVMRRR